MSLLSKAITGRISRPQKLVIYAPEGFGKSTLAAQFPKPFFLDVEGSTSQLDVQRLTREVLTDLSRVESALAELKSSPFQTVVVDTADWLEQMAVDAIIAAAKNDKITGIEDFGYGKGYTALKERMTITLSKFDALIQAGKHIVLLAHSTVRKFEPPDGAGPYDRYELKLSKQVAPLLMEWADAVLFGNYRTQVKERDKSEAGAQFKGVGGKERVMYCNRAAALSAKNRHGLGDVEKWEIATIKRGFLAVGAPWDETILPAKKEASHVASTPTPSEGANPPAVVAAAARCENCNEAMPDCDCEGLSQLLRKGSTADPDQIPGLPVVPAELSADDKELARILGPHAEAVLAYLVRENRIGSRQTFFDLAADYKARILKNPARFLEVVKASGKAVA